MNGHRIPLLVNVKAWVIGGILMAGSQVAMSSDALTVYSQFNAANVNRQAADGFAIVSHDRQFDIEKGISELRVTDVASRIDATTVSFLSLTDAKTHVLEQRYEYDLVSQQKLMARFIGKTIEVELDRGDGVEVLSGQLLSSHDGLTLAHDDGRITTLSSWRHVRFPALPDGLISKPTLVWRLSAAKGGQHDTRISYQTSGMAWWADYNLLLEESGSRCRANINAWVSLINQSGASYDQAQLKLVAGEVNRLQKQASYQVYRTLAVAEAEPYAAGFQEKAFFEYHLYTLGRPIDLPENSTTQVELFPAVQDVPCHKELIVDGTGSWLYRGAPVLDANQSGGTSMDVAVYLRFKNDKKSGLGIPLPEGRIRVNQVDPADGRIEFLGEDAIKHTPKDEDISVKVGNAFDVVGERKRTDYRIDQSGHRLWESFEITLRNHKEEAVDVVVLESLYRTANWTLEKYSDEFEKLNSNRVRFKVNVPADGEKKLYYSVYYTW